MIVMLAQIDAPFALPVGSNYVLATLVVGFLMSPITSALNRQRWSAELKAIGAFVWCLLAAVLLLFAGEQLNEVTPDPTSLVGTFLVIFVMAIGLYRWYYNPSGISDKIAAKTG
jgi:drug/metabolite transporter (DMT)-like permease